MAKKNGLLPEGIFEITPAQREKSRRVIQGLIQGQPAPEQDIQARLQALELHVSGLAQRVDELVAMREIEDACGNIDAMLARKQDELMSRLMLLEQRLME